SGLTRQFRTPYAVICELTIDADVITPSIRQRGISFFDHAAHVCFVSQANLDATRRHMAHEIPNARVVRNPVNLTRTEA
ncbi:hypothetical protein, partial [Acinetobacter baumannii]|uniref:hypothetical protein n=1 Tax=Acinetobacter baumannii TaxID=470 RepID=UPI0024B73AE6